MKMENQTPYQNVINIITAIVSKNGGKMHIDWGDMPTEKDSLSVNATKENGIDLELISDT